MRWSLLALVLAVAGVTLLFVPLEWAHPERVVVLAPEAISAETGRAFLVRFESPFPGDDRGQSPLRMLENGTELRAHSRHAEIRELGTGRFSHWGSWLYLSSIDGSDPRSNGRRYEVLLPGPLPAWHSRATFAALLGAVLAAAVGVVRTRTTRPVTAAGSAGTRPPRRWRAWAAWSCAGVTLLVAGLVAGGMMQKRAQAQRLQHLAADWVAPDAAAPVRPAEAVPAPRTLRLLGDPQAIEFHAGDSLPPSPDLIDPGFPERVRLAPGERLRSVPLPALRAAELAALLLPVRVLAGERVTLRWILHAPSAPAEQETTVDIVVPLGAAPDWQTLRVDAPLQLTQSAAGHGTDPLVVALELCASNAASGALDLELGEVRLVPAAAYFAQAAHGLEPIALGGSLRPAWWQSVRGESAVAVPRGAGRTLHGAVGIVVPSRRAAGAGAKAAVEHDVPIRIVLLVEDGSGQRWPLLETSARPSQGWVELEAHWPADVEPARLILVADEVPASGAVAWSGLRCIDTTRPARRVLLMLADTLRADAVGCCGGAPGSAPELEALARQGAAFTRCYSQAYWTRPSVPSIFTGRYVAATGVQTLGDRLPSGDVTLAERFAAAGFHTLAFLTNDNAGPGAGLDQGFDEVVLRIDNRTTYETAWMLESMVSARLRELPVEDLFVYVHGMEVHGPYGPPEPPPGWTAPAGAPLPFDASLDQPWLPQPTAAARRALYHADVTGFDADFGPWLGEWLARWESGADAPTIVAVMADHGEYLGEAGEWGHGYHAMLPAVLHVPLILRAPGAVEPGTRCDAIVQNTDVGATLLELAGAADPAQALPASEGYVGRSLVPLLRGDSGSARGAALAATGPSLLSVVLPDELLVGEYGKLVEGDGEAELQPNRGRFRATLWGELSSRGPAFEELWERYVRTQSTWSAVLRGWRGGTPPRPEDGPPSFTGADVQVLDPHTLEQLEALGYMGQGATGAEGPQR